MARTRDEIVFFQGVVYRMSRGNWKSFLEAKVAGQDATIANFNAKVLTQVDKNLSELTPDMAKAELDSLTVHE